MVQIFGVKKIWAAAYIQKSCKMLEMGESPLFVPVTSLHWGLSQ